MHHSLRVKKMTCPSLRKMVLSLKTIMYFFMHEEHYVQVSDPEKRGKQQRCLAMLPKPPQQKFALMLI
jgi:hypothetical protein